MTIGLGHPKIGIVRIQTWICYWMLSIGSLEKIAWIGFRRVWVSITNFVDRKLASLMGSISSKVIRYHIRQFLSSVNEILYSIRI